MALKRSREQLRKIAEQLQRVIDAQHPGAGMVLLVFDSRYPGNERPVSIALHGIDEEPAIRMLRQTADSMARVKTEDFSPLIIPPPNSFRSS